MKFFRLIFLILAISYYLVAIRPVYALSFDIQATTGTLTRNQDYDFTVTVDTQGQQLITTMADVTYDSVVLQLVSVTNGNFFTSISYTQTSSTTIRLTGTNTAAKSGAGSFAVVKFKIIATSPGSTTLCTVSPVEPTPTLAPTAILPTSPPVATSAPIPTAIPQAGALTWQMGALIALGLITLGVVGMMIL